MKFQHYLSLFASASAAMALQLSNGQLSSDGHVLAFDTSPEESILFNSTSSKLDISFDLEHSRQPDQIFVKLSIPKGVEVSFKPITKFTGQTFKNTFSLSYNKFPKLFTKEKHIDISLIVADIDGDKIFEKIGSIALTDSLIDKSKYEPVERYQAKPEIHHIFQQAPKQANSTIALVFCTIPILVFVALLGSWVSFGVLNFANFEFSITNFAFIALILGYETVFVQYYLGSSIFDTIGKVFVLLGPSVWFGSRVLNHTGELRLAGKR